MDDGLIERRALEAACAIATHRDVPCEHAAVIHSRSNVLVHLRPSPVVARVMTGTVVLHDDPLRWLTREVSVLSFLASPSVAFERHRAVRASSFPLPRTLQPCRKRPSLRPEGARFGSPAQIG